MTLQEIKIGTRLELEIQNKSGEKVGSALISQMQEYQEDGLIVISAPIYEARLIYLPNDVQIRISFVHHKYGLLGFTALVRAREFKGNIAVLVIEPVTEIEQIQRRMNFRLDILLDAVVMFPDAGNEPFKAITKNISGSGLCLICDSDFQKNTSVLVELRLTDNIAIKTKCLILRSNTAESRKGKKYEIGMCYTEIAKKDQDTLIKFIFDQQRLRLKGKK